MNVCAVCLHNENENNYYFSQRHAIFHNIIHLQHITWVCVCLHSVSLQITLPTKVEKIHNGIFILRTFSYDSWAFGVQGYDARTTTTTMKNGNSGPFSLTHTYFSFLHERRKKIYTKRIYQYSNILKLSKHIDKTHRGSLLLVCRHICWIYFPYLCMLLNLLLLTLFSLSTVYCALFSSQYQVIVPRGNKLSM